jgi:hypothetical protein
MVRDWSRDKVLSDQPRMSSLYFELDVFCQFEARVLEFDEVFSVQCTYIVQSTAVAELGVLVQFWTLALNTQITASPKYNNDIYLLISQYFISTEQGRWGKINYISGHVSHKTCRPS